MAKDLYHDQVKRALEKEEWKITHDPYELTVDSVDFEIDFGAERLIAAEKAGQSIAVEVKSFMGRSTVNEFQSADGQCNDYFVALEECEPTRVLYLANPENTWITFFQKSVIQKAIHRIGAKIIV